MIHIKNRILYNINIETIWNITSNNITQNVNSENISFKYNSF